MCFKRKKMNIGSNLKATIKITFIKTDQPVCRTEKPEGPTNTLTKTLQNPPSFSLLLKIQGYIFIEKLNRHQTHFFI